MSGPLLQVENLSITTRMVTNASEKNLILPAGEPEAISPLRFTNDVAIETFQNNQNFIVKDVSFSLDRGETLALVGESGSGKTLTALAIMQLLPPGAFIDPSSSIFLKQQDLLTFNELKMRQVRGKKIAIIFQEAITALNPVMPIGEQLIEVLSCHFSLGTKQKYQRAIAGLTEVGIPDPNYYFDAYPHQLSGGLKQRAMIAIALAGEPELLIADEPTTALDVTLQAQILDLLKTLQAKRGMGLMMITHDLGVVYQIAEKVIVLYQGQVVESAPAKDFFKKPQHPYSVQLFASLPPQVTVQAKAPEAKEILNVSGLKVYYPIKKGVFKRTVGHIKAVDDINLTLKEGETLALVGESGSGKTTTGMAILRLAPITTGKIIFEGINLATLNSNQLRQLRSDFQVVFQDPYGSMNPRMLVGEIIAEGLHLQKISEQKQLAKIDQLLKQVGLPLDAKFRYPHEFSGGQRQRICIARSLAMEPRFLICDEPTSALDVTAQLQILKLLKKLQQELGLSYLLITHNIAVVAYLANEVAVMHHGKIIESGLVSEVLLTPKHSYTKKLLNAVPKIDPNIDLDTEKK